MSNFALDPSYKDVAERLQDFRKAHPAGCLQPTDPARPFWFEQRGDLTFVVYSAAAFRTPDDPRPGIGVAWEPFPGRTPYTRGSEVMNAETSAWGRAIVAALASESRSVASADEVRNRVAEREALDDSPPGSESEKPQRHSRSVSSGAGDSTRLASEKQRGMLRAKLKAKGHDPKNPPGEWAAAELPAIDDAFPFSRVNDALALIESL